MSPMATFQDSFVRWYLRWVAKLAHWIPLMKASQEGLLKWLSKMAS